MPDEGEKDVTVIENSLNQKHGDGLGRYVLILAAIFAVLWLINSNNPGAGSGVNTVIEPPSTEIQSKNDPAAIANQERVQAEWTSDVFTYNEAISRKDKKLCERIVDESLRNDCIQTFRVNGIW